MNKLPFLLISCLPASLLAEQLRVEFITPSIVRVQFTAESQLPEGANQTGVCLERLEIPYNDRSGFSTPKRTVSEVPVKVKEEANQTAYLSDSLIVEVSKATQAITFRDRLTGKVLLQEANKPRFAQKVYDTKVIYDESTARTVQTADGQKVEMDVLRRDTLGFNWSYTNYFRFQPDEALYGLGCHVEDYLNLRGKIQYLTQHNLKAVVPVLNSTKGYGLLFDAGCAMIFDDTNADAGSLKLEAAKEIDYYFMKGQTLDAVIGQYRWLTGDCPMMPRYLFGYTQSKERYHSQHEIIETLAEYRRREVPIDMIVQDWHYWPQGWGYMHMDPKYYPDPKAMADSVHQMNAHLMVSIWPNPQGCPQFDDYNARGYMLPHSVYDAFSEEARRYYWQTADKEFFSKGFDAWWTDCSEPLDGDWKNMPNGYNHSNHKERYESTRQILTEALGAERSQLYCLYHSRGIYENQRAIGVQNCTLEPKLLKQQLLKRVVNLTRSSYAGQQRYSTITWNGDTYASWTSFKGQIPAGLNFMATGCPYWSVDVGSFFVKPDRRHRWFAVGEFPDGCEDPAYREYYTRMFQWATFLPMLRSHGTDTPREIWRFGEPGTPYYDAILKMIHLRYQLLPYTYSLAAMTSRQQYTIARLLAFDFANDPAVLDIKDEYMFGPALLVCPVTDAGATSRRVYLPKGAAWYDYWTNHYYKGGQWIDASAPLNRLPLFVRAGSIIPMGPVKQYADQPSDDPLTLKVYPGADADFALYDDDGDGQLHEANMYALTNIKWDDRRHTLSFGKTEGYYHGKKYKQALRIITPDGKEKSLTYKGKKLSVKL